MPKFDVVPPWRAVETSSSEAVQLAAELERELPLGHSLVDLRKTVRARRNDRDDILVSIEHVDSALAVVHLSWHEETDPKWPSTKFFVSWEHFAREEMPPAE